MDFIKDLLLKDIAEHIPFMIGVVGGRPAKLNVTRLSEVFIPFGIIFYFLFGMMDDVKDIGDRLSKIETMQTVNTTQVADLRTDMSEIHRAIQRIGFSRLTE